MSVPTGREDNTNYCIPSPIPMQFIIGILALLSTKLVSRSSFAIKKIPLSLPLTISLSLNLGTAFVQRDKVECQLVNKSSGDDDRSIASAARLPR